MKINRAAICHYRLRAGIPFREIGWNEAEWVGKFKLDGLRCLRFVTSLSVENDLSPAEVLVKTVEDMILPILSGKLYVKFGEDEMTDLQIKLSLKSLERMISLDMDEVSYPNIRGFAQSSWLDSREIFRILSIAAQNNFPYFVILSRKGHKENSVPMFDIDAAFSDNLNKVASIVGNIDECLTNGRGFDQNIMDILYLSV
ncbi:MAG: hypothetical protein AABZ73_03020 [Pseudomonadota bacterium]|uniref:hypothetical protein n=1 Tax=Sphingobium sp. TaxID=1912891 RepID=UPI002E1EE80B